MKHRDLRNDRDFWNSLRFGNYIYQKSMAMFSDIRGYQYFSEIIGSDHTERLRQEFKDKPLPKR